MLSLIKRRNRTPGRQSLGGSRRRHARRFLAKRKHARRAPSNNGEPIMQDLEEAIRERAYHLWIEDGQQDGHAEHYWLAAQRSILSALLGASDAGEISGKPKKAKVPRKKRAA